jgi:hypothetical protein
VELWKYPFSYFTSLYQFEYWRNFEILKKIVYHLLGPAHCDSPSPPLFGVGLMPTRPRAHPHPGRPNGQRARCLRPRVSPCLAGPGFRPRRPQLRPPSMCAVKGGLIPCTLEAEAKSTFSSLFPTSPRAPTELLCSTRQSTKRRHHRVLHCYTASIVGKAARACPFHPCHAELTSSRPVPPWGPKQPTSSVTSLVVWASRRWPHVSGYLRPGCHLLMDCTVSLMLPGPRAGHPDHFTAPLSTFSFDRTVPPWRSFHGEPLSPQTPQIGSPRCRHPSIPVTRPPRCWLIGNRPRAAATAAKGSKLPCFGYWATSPGTTDPLVVAGRSHQPEWPVGTILILFFPWE